MPLGNPENRPAPPGQEGTSGAFHRFPPEEVLRQLASTPQGLDETEVAKRLEVWGPNELTQVSGPSAWALFLGQFKNALILTLLVATLISGILGHGVEAVAITVIILFAVTLGFVQEYRAERALESLRHMSAPHAVALRGGVERSIPTREVVPGDILLLSAGNRVPADGRILEAAALETHEAVLTGESMPVSKHARALDDENLALGDRRNTVYAGTVVARGRGRFVATATGMRTELGKIACLLGSVDSGRTPLQESLDRLGLILARAALVIVAIISVMGVVRGQGLLDMLVFGIALAVAVVPEALPAVVTISLALGVQRLARRRALIRRLPAVEALGSTSVICSDKTGTLTRDEMAVRAVFTCDGLQEADAGLSSPSASVRELLLAAALCSDAHEVGTDAAGTGDPTELALVAAARRAGLQKAELDADHPRLAEVPFAPETRRMTTLNAGFHPSMAFSKGAPEVILDACGKRLTRDGEEPLNAEARATILDAARSMAGNALRVMAVARKATTSLQTAESGMTFLGLLGLIDPPRPEAREAIATCGRAGIQVVMITGDHPLTAEAVARELGLPGDLRAVTGIDIDAMTDEELARGVESISIYARVSPAHKLRVVTALQAKGHVVAMTGDGANDAPALKKADIGVAMGITGTDVAIEAAAMTLTDDNFASIVAAVEEGRGVFGNIRKYLMFLLSSNIGEIGLMAGCAVVGLPMPLTAVQILYVNLATDGLPALALAVDPPETDLMSRPPRDPKAGVFTRPVAALILTGGLWSTIANLTLFGGLLAAGRALPEAMAMTFISLVLIQLFKAYNFRSDRETIFQKPLANRWLNLAVLWELLALVLIVLIPWLQRPFGTFALSPGDWLVVVSVALTIIPVLELAKWCVRRR